MFMLLLALAAWLIIGAWALFQRRTSREFEIRILRNGRVRLTAGQPRGHFLDDVQAIATRHGLTRGKVRGVRTPRLVRLSFAGRIPNDARQQMRNAWGMVR